MRGNVAGSPYDEDLLARCQTGQQDDCEALAERIHRLAESLTAFRQAWSSVEVDDLMKENQVRRTWSPKTEKL